MDDDEITTAFDMLFGFDMPPLYLYDHFGSTDVELICNRIEYMAGHSASNGSSSTHLHPH